MNYITVLLAAFAVSGCTRIAVNQPVGASLDKNLTDLAGVWIGHDEEIWTVTVSDGPLPLTVANDEDGVSTVYHCTLTETTHEVRVLWVQDEKLNAYIPFRVAFSQEAFALLYPDKVEVKRMVDSGMIEGRFDQAADSWLLSSAGLEQHLESKAFWLLDFSLPFLKKKTEEEANQSLQTTPTVLD